MKYKNIKSAAHNFGYSFLSDMNAVGEGSRYIIVPKRLFEAAREMRLPKVRVDFLTGSIEPEEARIPELVEAVGYYMRSLPKLLVSQDVSPESIVSANLTIEFDYDSVRRTKYHPEIQTQDFRCTVEFTDDRGRKHVVHPKKWWPE